MQNNTSQFYSSNAYNNQQVCGAGTTDYYGVASLGSIEPSNTGNILSYCLLSIVILSAINTFLNSTWGIVTATRIIITACHYTIILQLDLAATISKLAIHTQPSQAYKKYIGISNGYNTYLKPYPPNNEKPVEKTFNVPMKIREIGSLSKLTVLLIKIEKLSKLKEGSKEKKFFIKCNIYGYSGKSDNSVLFQKLTILIWRMQN
ncbi:hypothetical protein U3516DRAFT_768264 [Neocallimastix sp. 'constans']